MTLSLRLKNVAGAPNRLLMRNLSGLGISKSVNPYSKVTFSTVVDNVKLHDRLVIGVHGGSISPYWLHCGMSAPVGRPHSSVLPKGT